MIIKGGIYFLIFVFSFNVLYIENSWGIKEVPDMQNFGEEFTAPQIAVENFKLPSNLGIIQDKYISDAGTGKTIVYIQDAHCNYAAQKKISEILEFLSDKHGISTINLEGGVGPYELDIFTLISDKDIRHEVSENFVISGTVSGAEFYAINTADDIFLWGVEDTDLYLKNLNVYRDSFQYRDKLDSYLKELSHIYNNLKLHIYSRELLDMDMKYTQYKTGNMDFRDYVVYLLGEAKKRMVDVKKYTNVYFLAQTLDEEEKINFRKANLQRDLLIDELQKKLSRRDIEELVKYTVNFRTKRISAKEFYKYLIKKADIVNIDLNDFSSFKKFVNYTLLYYKIDRMALISEIDGLENRIKETFYTDNAQRELNILSKDLTVLKNMFNIRMTKHDYEYYIKNREAFRINNFISFADKHVHKYGISAGFSPGINEVDVFSDKMEKFYKYSFERDGAFIRNMRFSGDAGRDAGRSVKEEAAVLITGGFHGDNILKLFKEEGISYISILPAFKNKRGYESPYFSLLAGKEPDMGLNIGNMLPSAWKIAIASRLNRLGVEAGGKREEVIFRLQVRWMEARASRKEGLFVEIAENGDTFFVTSEGAVEENIVPETDSYEIAYVTNLGEVLNAYPETSAVEDLGLELDLEELSLETPEEASARLAGEKEDTGLELDLSDEFLALTETDETAPEAEVSVSAEAERGTETSEAALAAEAEVSGTSDMELSLELEVPTETPSEDLLPERRIAVDESAVDSETTLPLSEYEGKEIEATVPSPGYPDNIFRGVITNRTKYDDAGSDWIIELSSGDSFLLNSATNIKEAGDQEVEEGEMVNPASTFRQDWGGVSLFADRRLFSDYYDAKETHGGRVLDIEPEKAEGKEKISELLEYHEKLIEANFDALSLLKSESLDVDTLKKMMGHIEKMTTLYISMGEMVEEEAREKGETFDSGKDNIIAKWEDIKRAIEELMPRLDAVRSASGLERTDFSLIFDLMPSGIDKKLENVATLHAFINFIHQKSFSPIFKLAEINDTFANIRFAGESETAVRIVNAGEDALTDNGYPNNDVFNSLLGSFDAMQNVPDIGMSLMLKNNSLFGDVKLGEHSASFHVSLAQPEDGGMILVRYKGNPIGGHGELQRMRYMEKIFKGMEMDVSMDEKDWYIEARIDKDHGLKDMNQIKETLPKIINMLIFTKDLNVVFGFMETGDNKSLAESQVDKVVDYYNANGKLPLYDIFVGVPNYEIGYLSDEMLAKVQSLLSDLGLPQIPSGIEITQKVVDDYFNNPIDRGLSRGEFLFREDVLERNYDYPDMESFLSILPEGRAEIRDIGLDSLDKLKPFIQTGGIITSIENVIPFEVMGIVGGVFAERGIFEAKGGRQLLVDILRSQDGRILFSRVSERGEGTSFNNVSVEELTGYLEEMGTEVSSAAISYPIARNSLEEIKRELATISDTGDITDFVGEKVSKGKDEPEFLQATFKRKEKFDDKKALFTPYTEPEDTAFIDSYGAIVTNSGSPLAHAGIMTREAKIPSIILRKARQIVTDKEELWRVTNYMPDRNKLKSVNGFDFYDGVVTVSRDIREGDWVKVDGKNGTLTVVKGDSEYAEQLVEESRSGTKDKGPEGADDFSSIEFVRGTEGSKPVIRLDELDRYDRASVTEDVGGKAINLGLIVSIGKDVGFDTADGSVVTTKGFYDFVSESGIEEDILETLRSDLGWDKKENAIKNLFLGRTVSGERITGERRRKYDAARSVLEEAIAGEFGLKDNVRYAIRSSNISEDSSDAAFAGAGDTYLNVTKDEVVDKVIENFASFANSRALQYRLSHNMVDLFIGHAVVIQEMVRSNKAGIIFTRDVAGEDLNRVMINAGEGLGEAIVSGQDADTYRTDRSGNEIMRFVPGYKFSRIISKSDGGTEDEIIRGRNLIDTEVKRKNRALSPEIIQRLTKIAVQIEARYKEAVDVEFGITEEGNIYILQVRAITTIEGEPGDGVRSDIAGYIARQERFLDLIKEMSDSEKAQMEGVKDIIEGMGVLEDNVTSLGRFSESLVEKLFVALTPENDRTINRFFREILPANVNTNPDRMDRVRHLMTNITDKVNRIEWLAGDTTISEELDNIDYKNWETVLNEAWVVVGAAEESAAGRDADVIDFTARRNGEVDKATMELLSEKFRGWGIDREVVTYFTEELIKVLSWIDSRNTADINTRIHQNHGWIISFVSMSSIPHQISLIRNYDYDQYMRLVEFMGAERVVPREEYIPALVPGSEEHRRLMDDSYLGAIASGRYEAVLREAESAEDIVRRAQGYDETSMMDKLRQAVEFIDRAITGLNREDSKKYDFNIISQRIKDAADNGNLYFFNAIVDSPEDYLLGFSIVRDGNLASLGLSVELMEYLSPKDLAEYVFHEAHGETDINTHGDLYGRGGDKGLGSREKTRDESLQGILFKSNTLKGELRKFIDRQARQKALRQETDLFRSVEPDIYMEQQGEDVSRFADKAVAERMSGVIASGGEIRLQEEPVTVLSGYLYSPDTGNAVRKVNREFNSEIKLKFGEDRDNQQMRLFRMYDIAGYGAGYETATIASMLKEFASSYKRFDKMNTAGEGTLVVYAPEAAWNWQGAPGDQKSAILDWIAANRPALQEEGLSSSDMDNINTSLSDERVVIMKDTYGELTGAEGTITMPDIAFRFVLARHIGTFINSERKEAKLDAMRNILELMIVGAGEDIDLAARYEEILSGIDQMDSADLTKVISNLVIRIEPIEFSEIPQYAEMMEEVARSL